VNTISCRQAWQNMTEQSAARSVRNYIQLLAMDDYLVETDLFPEVVLEAYTAWNLERPLTAAQKEYFNAERGGGQGDYREGMRKKIANVVDCLNHFPTSKRALITISNTAFPNHKSDDDAKCLREIHFYLEDGHLNATCLFRAQAALIFPKNIHFIGALMDEIAQSLTSPAGLGKLFYCATILVSDRS